MWRRITLSFILASGISPIFGQSAPVGSPASDKMRWFSDAKLGIFIHWGIYSVDGVDESWSFHNRKMSWTDYMRQLKGFTASRYDPSAWASLIRESGARYAVITTKHHDGVALWDTREPHYDVRDSTPARRDLLSPLFEALRREGIRTGAYYSLIDWSHPDYPGFIKDSARYRIADDPARWERFNRFNHAQIAEVDRLLRPDLWWFDGDWEQNAEEWRAEKIRKDILGANPSAIINGRLAGYGDYATPEQNFPVKRPEHQWWELCMTLNDNWGYQPSDTNWKTPYEVISVFADVVSNGGNLLLDIGPRQDGTLTPEQVNVLRELGRWNRKHGEAVFGTQAGLPPGHFHGPSTISKDSTELFLFLPARVSGKVVVRGLSTPVERIRVVGHEREVPYKVVGKISWSKVPGLLYIDVPADLQDEHVTVLRMNLKGPLQLYRGEGGL